MGGLGVNSDGGRIHVRWRSMAVAVIVETLKVQMPRDIYTGVTYVT